MPKDKGQPKTRTHIDKTGGKVDRAKPWPAPPTTPKPDTNNSSSSSEQHPKKPPKK